MDDAIIPKCAPAFAKWSIAERARKGLPAALVALIDEACAGPLPKAAQDGGVPAAVLRPA